MSKKVGYLKLLGPFSYVVAWLFFMPMVAEASTAAAILSLTLLTGLYCFAAARVARRNEVFWGILGALAAFVELGLIPVLIISLMSNRHMAGKESDPRSFNHAT